ncbi:Protein OSCP1 [Sarcoptes scabiei]|uniref:Protein OSCP1 n=1 Tax=Sarcoptes scabiei TaxID=52283 RepID=A0A834VH40_SARSC|nr:Protein OSCP1 [Sarcoptes scabiei]
MAIDTFPILYFNMAGEMIYIIDQRLRAQNISQSRSIRVLNDIVLSVFNSKLIDEVFKPHNSITFSVLKTIFEKLVHSSIMRLNELSMNKLFDLMIMVIKYQLISCPKPSDIITITDNHLISIIDLLNVNRLEPNGTVERKEMIDLLRSPSAEIRATSLTMTDNTTINIVNVVRNQFLFHFQHHDSIQFQLIRYGLLNFFKDIRTRVSIFLRDGTQNSDGIFLMAYDHVSIECECQIPGFIRYFQGSSNEIIRTDRFNVGCEYVINDRRTSLGLNIFCKENQQSIEKNCFDNETNNETNQKEIEFLAKLICKTSNSSTSAPLATPPNHELKFDFLQNNFQVNNNEIEEKQCNEANRNEKLIQISSTRDEQLVKIIEELNEITMLEKSYSDRQQQATKTTSTASDQEIANDEIDLLELMDS